MNSFRRSAHENSRPNPPAGGAPSGAFASGAQAGPIWKPAIGNLRSPITVSSRSHPAPHQRHGPTSGIRSKSSGKTPVPPGDPDRNEFLFHEGGKHGRGRQAGPQGKPPGNGHEGGKGPQEGPDRVRPGWALDRPPMPKGVDDSLRPFRCRTPRFPPESDEGVIAFTSLNWCLLPERIP